MTNDIMLIQGNTFFLSFSTLLYTDTKPNWFLIDRAFLTIGDFVNGEFWIGDFDLTPSGMEDHLSLECIAIYFFSIWRAIAGAWSSYQNITPSILNFTSWNESFWFLQTVKYKAGMYCSIDFSCRNPHPACHLCCR